MERWSCCCRALLCELQGAWCPLGLFPGIVESLMSPLVPRAGTWTGRMLHLALAAPGLDQVSPPTSHTQQEGAGADPGKHSSAQTRGMELPAQKAPNNCAN